jgi:multidrug efflux pump subunit AcrA (membrane-fusion protein)
VARQHAALEPGGVIEAGAELVAIDRSDYELALAAKQAELEEARFALEVERGRQVVALREWKLLEGDVPKEDANRSLVLRKPHLRRAEALVEKAENDIALAELDLTRTSVTAPFNAVVIEESVEVGQLLERGTSVTTLAGADEFWVRVSVPVDRLRWIQLPRGEYEGAKAKVVLDAGEGREFTREGRVLRLLGDLEPNGRMARMLVSIADPLGRHDRSGEIPLLLGSYVQVEIDAGVLEGVVVIRRAALREGNRIWVVDGSNRLQIRDVEVLWFRKDSVLLAKESI